MQHRIRAAGILIEQNRMLLLKVQDETGEYWLPPGGGMEPNDISTKGCLRREFFEEAGVQVELGDLICVREFLESQSHRYNAEFFYQVLGYRGTPSTENLAGLNDEGIIKGVEWVALDQLAQLRTYPTDLLSLALRVQNEQFSHHLGSYIQGDDELTDHLR